MNHVCPHCGESLKEEKKTNASGRNVGRYVCSNPECPYRGDWR